MAILNSDLLHATVHYSTKFGLIAEILKELERERRAGQTDGQADRQTDGRTDGRITDDNTLQRRWRPRVKMLNVMGARAQKDTGLVPVNITAS